LHYTIVFKEKPTQDDVRAIAAPLQQFNLDSGPPPRYKSVALAVESGGQILGGLWGQCAYDWLHVEYLVVPAALRRQGLGRKLLAQAEQIAAAHGCIGVWLDTLAFQALPFYEKLGYHRFGQIDDQPPGSPHYFLKKRLSPNPTPATESATRSAPQPPSA
jgi:GNAT superfamily N-acetyltransferase